MVSCANSIAITCFQIFAGRSPAQCVSGCCPSPRSTSLSETCRFHMERGFSCRDWCDWPCLYLGAAKCHPRWDPCRAELDKEEQLVIWCEHYNTNTGFGPPPKAPASQRRLHSSKTCKTGLWFSLTAACLPAVGTAASLPRVRALPDLELELWLKLPFIVVSC